MDPHPDPDQFVRGMDPRIQIRIRIHPKMSWIRNTASCTVRYLDEPAGLKEGDNVLWAGEEGVELLAEAGQLVPQAGVALHLLLIPHPQPAQPLLQLLHILVHL